MAYSFNTQKVASFKFDGTLQTPLNVPSINGQEADANVIISGIKGMLWIAGAEDDYDPERAVRTVKQNVNYDD